MNDLFWKFDEEKSQYNLDFNKLMDDTIRKMMQAEEDGRIQVIVGYLRENGWTVEPIG